MGSFPDDPGASEVRFPAVENWPEVGEHDVVIGHHPVRRAFLVGPQRVGTRPDDSLVPVTFDPEALRCDVTHCIACGDIAHSRPQDIRLANLLEEFRSLALRIPETRNANTFVNFVACSHGDARRGNRG